MNVVRIATIRSLTSNSPDTMHPGTQAEAGMGRRAAAAQDDAGAVDGPRIGVLDTAAPTLVVLLIAVCIGADLASDILSRRPVAHMIGMIVGSALCLACLALMWRLLRASQAQARALGVALDSTRADLVEWRSKAAETLHGLGALIDRQFHGWGLSLAEREVGLLLLKGLSLKDIAAARKTSERTARQQALALYRKAGLAGRAELAAFFLEDLLVPAPAAEAPRHDVAPAREGKERGDPSGAPGPAEALAAAVRGR